MCCHTPHSVPFISLDSQTPEFISQRRAEIIATYALCGFSNLSSIGINLGGFSAMAPGRKADLAKVVVRAMIAGSAACFLTACVAGMFFAWAAKAGTSRWLCT